MNKSKATRIELEKGQRQQSRRRGGMTLRINRRMQDAESEIERATNWRAEQLDTLQWCKEQIAEADSDIAAAKKTIEKLLALRDKLAGGEGKS